MNFSSLSKKSSFLKLDQNIIIPPGILPRQNLEKNQELNFKLNHK